MPDYIMVTPVYSNLYGVMAGVQGVGEVGTFKGLHKCHQDRQPGHAAGGRKYWADSSRGAVDPKY